MATKEYYKQRYIENREKIKEYGRVYRIKNKEKLRERKRKYYQTHKSYYEEYRKKYFEKNKDWLRIYWVEKHQERKHKIGFTARGKKYREKNPFKYHAHKAVQLALYHKKFKKEPCSVCGIIKMIHAHHPDYSRPLEIIWLCPVHHKEIHKKK